MDIRRLKSIRLLEKLSPNDVEQIAGWTDEADVAAGTRLVYESGFRYPGAAANERSPPASPQPGTGTTSWAVPSRREQINKQLIGEQNPPVMSQKGMHRTLRHEMTTQRRRIQQLTLRREESCIPHPPTARDPSTQRRPTQSTVS
jgi:hypothetical protein